MTSTRPYRLLPLTALLLTLVLAACGGQQTGASLSVSIDGPAALNAGEDAVLTATASGENAAAGEISWSTEAGTLTPATGPTSTWTAPTEPGTYTVTATIEATGDTASDTISVQVADEPTEEEKPLSITITGIDDEALLGVAYDLEALLEGTDADEADVTWVASAGTLDTMEGRNVRWTAPGESGPAWITASVTGTSVDDTAMLNVFLCRDGQGATEAAPCPITNVVQLQAMQEDLTLHYALANDIDATATQTWGPANEGFLPLRGEGFRGSLNGNGFSIDGLFINRPETDFVGLFSVTHDGSLITDLQLTALDVTGRSIVAGLVGQNGGTISNTAVSGSVTATDTLLPTGPEAYAGGLVAINGGLIEHTASSALVASNGGLAGGLVGVNESRGRIEHSLATSSRVEDSRAHAPSDVSGIGGLAGRNGGTISDSYSAVGRVQSSGGAVGGLVGLNNRGVILRSFTHSNTEVLGSYNVGGLVGENSSATIMQTYSQARSVQADSSVGGLVGYQHGNSEIAESYSTSAVQGKGDAGGLVGKQFVGTITTRSFWDLESSGLLTSAGGAGAIGVMSSEMHAAATFMDEAWDLEKVWIMPPGGGRPPELQGNQP